MPEDLINEGLCTGGTWAELQYKNSIFIILCLVLELVGQNKQYTGTYSEKDKGSNLFL